MDKKIVGNCACPSCVSQGRDRTGNHLIIFEKTDGSKFGWCSRCKYLENPLGEETKVTPKKVWSEDELQERLDEIKEYPIQDLETRKIPQWVCEYYGVRVGLSEEDGVTQREHYYPRFNDSGICRYNVRLVEQKAFFSIGPQGLPFGFNTLFNKGASRVKLFIFEDELSTMTGYLVLKAASKPEYRDMQPACIGLSAGSGSIVDTLQSLRDRGLLEQFQEVIYVHDNDKAGEESYQKGRSLYPKLKGVTTDLKDANDMLMAGRQKELTRTLLFGGRVRSPDGAANVTDALADAATELEQGIDMPWDGLNQLVKMHYGTLWSIGGGVGSGKTLLVHSIAAHIIKKNIPVACFMLEERLGKSLVNISTHLSNCRIGLFEADKLGQVIHDFDLNNNLHLWKNKGQNDWDNIAQCIRFYAVVLGVKVFFVDNVTAITNTLSPTEQNTEIARVATEAHGLADELDIAVVLLSHLNPPSSGPSHEEGGEVRPVQFTGSRALMRWSDVMIGFERNLYAEGEYKHHSKIRVIKDREAGKTGVIKTIYDVETGGLYERVEESTEEAESW